MEKHITKLNNLINNELDQEYRAMIQNIIEGKINEDANRYLISKITRIGSIFITEHEVKTKFVSEKAAKKEILEGEQKEIFIKYSNILDKLKNEVNEMIRIKRMYIKKD